MIHFSSHNACNTRAHESRLTCTVIARRELYDTFVRSATNEQLDRFEHWKRSKFPRADMRRLQGDILGSSSENGSILLVRRAHQTAGEHGSACTSTRAGECALRFHLCCALSARNHDSVVPLAWQAAAAKMFVGDLVESARERMTAANESGPIQPVHLRQAHRRMQRAGGTVRSSPRLFWRSECGP